MLLGIKNSLIVTVAILLAMPMAAFSDESIQTCLEIDNGEERLSCYDGIHGFDQQTVSSDTEKEEVFGDGWVLMSGKDEFTGADTSRVYLEELGRAGERDAAVLSLGCQGDGSYGVLLYKSTFISTSRRVPVRYKFDDNELISENWFGSASGNGALLPNGYKDFRSQLQNSKRLVVEMTDYRGVGHRHIFEGLAKNKDELDFIMSGCESNK